MVIREWIRGTEVQSNHRAGYSAARLAHLFWEQEVVCSNHTIPIITLLGKRFLSVSKQSRNNRGISTFLYFFKLSRYFCINGYSVREPSTFCSFPCTCLL